MTPAEMTIARKNERAAKLIRKGMVDKDISNVSELADRIGMSKSTLYERMKAPLSMSGAELYLLSRAVGLRVAELFGEVKT